MSNTDLTAEELDRAGAPGAVAPLGGAAPRVGSPVVPETHRADLSDRLVSALDLLRRALHSLALRQDPALDREIEHALERLALASSQGELPKEAAAQLEAQQEPLAAELAEVVRRIVRSVEAARL